MKATPKMTKEDFLTLVYDKLKEACKELDGMEIDGSNVKLTKKDLEDFEVEVSSFSPLIDVSFDEESRTVNVRVDMG